jgi:hypothetical protein
VLGTPCDLGEEVRVAIAGHGAEGVTEHTEGVVQRRGRAALCKGRAHGLGRVVLLPRARSVGNIVRPHAMYKHADVGGRVGE